MGQFIAPIAAAFESSSLLTTVTSVLGIAGTIYETAYQRQVAKNNAEVMNANAERAAYSGQISAQDSDMNAAAAIAAEQNARAFSGFAGDSGTFQRADRRNRIMARRDSLRIRNEADVTAANYKAKAAEAKAEAKAIGIKGFFDVIGQGFKFASSAINDASLVDVRKAKQVNRITMSP